MAPKPPKLYGPGPYRTLTIKMAKDLADELEALGIANGRSTSAEARLAIDRYLDAEAPEEDAA